MADASRPGGRPLAGPVGDHVLSALGWLLSAVGWLLSAAVAQRVAAAAPGSRTAVRWAKTTTLLV
jgi:hypothetical protein